MRIIIWGIGEHLKRYIDRLCMEDVVCFIDRKPDESCGEFKGKTVVVPERLSDIEYDLVIVSSVKYYSEIAAELVSLYSVPYRKIVLLDYWLNINAESFRKKSVYDLGKMIQRYDHNTYDQIFRKPWRLMEDNNNLLHDKLGYEYVYHDRIMNGKSENDFLLYLNGTIIKLPYSSNKALIYVVAHKPFSEIRDPLYKTIWVGDHKHGSEKDFYDNTGDEISEYNSLINECSALYWMWKNDKESDFIGLNHYRRYFESPLNSGCPLQRWEVDTILKESDIIVAEHVDLKESNALGLCLDIGDEPYESSYRILREIFDNKDEKEKRAFDQYLNDSILFPCQMFIMDRQKLNEYCSWLFPIVFEMIDKIEIKDSWSKYSKRVIGFWAERLFTVWLLFTGYRIEEVPIIKTDNEEPYGR